MLLMIPSRAPLLAPSAATIDVDHTALTALLQRYRTATTPERSVPLVGFQFAQQADDTQGVEYAGVSALPEGLDLRDLVFIGCDFTGVAFPATTRLAGAHFSCCIFDRALFCPGLNLHHVIFAGCSLYGTTFSDTTLESVEFSHCEGQHLDFRRATLNTSAIMHCQFEHTMFSSAVLSDTGIVESTLNESDLCGADLESASFYSVGLQGIRIDPSTWISDTERELVAALLRIAALDACDKAYDRVEAAEVVDASVSAATLEASHLLTRRLAVVGLLLERPTYGWHNFTRYARALVAEDTAHAMPLLQWIYETLQPYERLRARLQREGFADLIGRGLPPGV